MTIYNLGSINIDHIYRLNHLPRPGETLTSRHYGLGLGGKGANQSMAAARAGARIVHIGAISDGDDWVLHQMQAAGIDTAAIARLPDITTGHAIILVDDDAENAIILHGGANRHLTESQIRKGLAAIGPADILLLQNETSQQVCAAQMARAAAARVIYSAAPFSVGSVRDILPFATILAMNEGESRQVFARLGADLPVDGLLITKGVKGAEYRDLRRGKTWHQPAFPVTPVDTTGAGDCFAGWFAAGLDQGCDIPRALRHAAAAAALQVTRSGAGPAMPDRDEVAHFLGTALPSAQPSLSAQGSTLMSEE